MDDYNEGIEAETALGYASVERQAAEAERAKVVAWLRGHAEPPLDTRLIRILADAIENGAHLSEEG